MSSWIDEPDLYDAALAPTLVGNAPSVELADGGVDVLDPEALVGTGGSDRIFSRRHVDQMNLGVSDPEPMAPDSGDLRALGILQPEQ